MFGRAEADKGADDPDLFDVYESPPLPHRKLEEACLDDCCVGLHRHSRFKRSQWEHRGLCSLHLTFRRLGKFSCCDGWLEKRSYLTYRHVKQPDLDLGGRRGVGEPAEECDRTDSFIVVLIATIRCCYQGALTFVVVLLESGEHSGSRG